MPANLEKIYDYIDAHFDEHVGNVQRLIRQPSISFTGEGVVDCANMLIDMIRDLGGERAELCEFEDEGWPVVYGEMKSKNPDAKTLIVYTLYDVMPVDEEGWVVDPFSAEIIDGTKIHLPEHYGKAIIGRGVRNQKGPIGAFLNTLSAMKEVEGDIPVNVIFAFDGEEEFASPHFSEFVKRYEKDLMRADAAYYCNPGSDEHNVHNMYIGFRGIIPLELEVKGGDWGGPARGPLFSAEDAILDAPAWRLIWALSTLKDPDGKVLIDGFYDDFRPPNAEEKELIEKVRAKSAKSNSETFKQRLGVKQWKRGKRLEDLFEGYLWGPIINIDGLVSGYTGPRIKTTLPHKATAKLDIRLFPDMDREDIIRKLRKHLDKHGFPEVEIKWQTFGNAKSGWNSARSSYDTPLVHSALRAGEKLGAKDTVVWPIYFAFVPLGMFAAPPFNLPIVSAGLGWMGNEHQENEYFTLDGVRIYEKWVATFLHDFAQS
ncbi:MAG: M20/M25/M40 family metallo-hydrolase [Candidatus Binatia bacterium]|jgi:acetylornithine deacetylase/succinyl-diaminopimelate desuccinylase-like protein|nr:M20/M25/M40 family metallo-hydrolase [Candidatus Binatia bacterium]